MKIIVQRENLVLWHLICFSVLLAFTACSDNKEEFQEYLTPASGSEAIFEQGFSFAEAASSQSVSFEAGYQWTAELSGEDSGASFNYQLTFALQEHHPKRPASP